MARTVNENSPLYMTIILKDENGDPLVPSTVEWRLDDGEGLELVAWTNITGPGSTTEMVIPGSDNSMQDQTNVKELRAFGIRVNGSQAGETFSEFKYHILNLIGVG